MPQTPGDLVYLSTVDAELEQADRESAGAQSPPARELLDRLAPGIAGELEPRDLSEGQSDWSLVLSDPTARAAPRVMLLDEPTRGLDYHAKHELIAIVDRLAADGDAVVIATHDVEFGCRCLRDRGRGHGRGRRASSPTGRPPRSSSPRRRSPRR